MQRVIILFCFFSALTSVYSQQFADLNKTNDFSYDYRGSLSKDLNKEVLNIKYNHLDFPTKITLKQNRVIDIVYDAKGRVVSRTSTDNSANTIVVVNRIGNLCYKKQANNSNFSTSFNYEMGVLDKNQQGVFESTYFVKDHLDNVRIVFSDNDKSGMLTANQTNNVSNEVTENMFYPFGMQINVRNALQSSNKNDFTFNQKEVIPDFGLNYLDFGSRMYNSEIGKWNSVDAHNEKYASWSSYGFVHNNPLKYNDPDGKDAIITIDAANNTITISLSVKVYGPDASKRNAQQLEMSIHRAWTNTRGNNISTYYDEANNKQYKIVLDVKAELYDPENEKADPWIIPGAWNPFNRDNYVRLDYNAENSYIDDGDDAQVNSKDDEIIGKIAGIMMGHENKTIEFMGSNGEMHEHAEPGWKGNLMGNSSSVNMNNYKEIFGRVLDNFNRINKDITSIGINAIPSPIGMMPLDHLKLAPMKTYTQSVNWILPYYTTNYPDMDFGKGKKPKQSKRILVD